MNEYRPDRYEIEQLVRMLVEKYPQCFFENPKLRRPLKKNIYQDLISDAFPVTPKLLTAAVDWYQSHFAYHYALQAGGERIGLDGKVVGKVTEQEAMIARNYIAERQREMNERSKNSPVQIMASLYRAGKVPDDALRKIPAPQASASEDPVARLRASVDAVRRVIIDTPSDPTLRAAFAIAGLGVVIKEAQKVIEELQPH
jgi:sRNA-binding protein